MRKTKLYHHLSINTTTTPQHHNITTPQHHNTTTSQHHGITSFCDLPPPWIVKDQRHPAHDKDREAT